MASGTIPDHDDGWSGFCSLMRKPEIAVVIPVRNEAATIAACIDGILAQSIAVREIVVLDSMSADGTREILHRYPAVRVIDVDPATFNHGTTRNTGVQLARGADYVLFTVGDARAADSRWIERLLAGFENENVAGVCGHQVVPAELQTNPVEWSSPESGPSIVKYRFPDAAAFESLPAREKRIICSWDNVTAMYRRRALLDLPFEPVTYCEDIIWANAAIRRGWALTYVNAAQVYHFHHETPEFLVTRAHVVSRYRLRLFNDLPDRPATARNIAVSIRRLLTLRNMPLGKRIGWLRYNVRNQIALRRAIDDFLAAASAGETKLDALCACDSASLIPSKQGSAQRDPHGAGRSSQSG
jgi:rhamnosyltransferase